MFCSLMPIVIPVSGIVEKWGEDYWLSLLQKEREAFASLI